MFFFKYSFCDGDEIFNFCWVGGVFIIGWIDCLDLM